MGQLEFNYEAILNQLGDGRSSDMCYCPAHDDKTPSLHVSQKDGRVLFKCHAGCSQEAVISALKTHGLCKQSPSLSRSSTKRWTPPPEDEAYQKFRNAYSILRAGMGCIGLVRQLRKPNAQKELTLYLKGRGLEQVPLNALYVSAKESRALTGIGLPALVFPILSSEGLQGAHLTFLTKDGTKNARDKNGKNLRRMYGSAKGGYIPLGVIDRDKPLIVAEGIETALSASRIAGLPAIAALSADNMKVITPPPSSEVIIAADTDERGTGEAAAKELAQRLVRSGRVVRIGVIELPKGHAKWDFNDELQGALKDGSDLTAIRDELLSITPFEGADEVSDLVQPLGMELFMKLVFPPRQYLLKPWLTTTGLVMIDAKPEHGKTWLALSVAYAVASGQPLLEWPVERAARVLYVDGELPGELLQSRLRMLGEPLPESNLLVLSRAQFELYSELLPDLAKPEGREFLDKIIEHNKIELVVLDSVSTLVRSGVDNDVESWRAIQDWSLKHRAHGRAIIYLHHQGKSGGQRGTSAREIVLDTRVSLNLSAELTTADETAFKLDFPKAREFYGADAAPMLAYLSTKSGTVEWRRESVKASNKVRVRELREQGMKPSEIAKELHITPGRVSQLMKELLEEEHMEQRDAV